MELYKYTGSVAALTVRFGKAETITLYDSYDDSVAPVRLDVRGALAEYIKEIESTDSEERYMNLDWYYDFNMLLRRIEVPGVPSEKFKMTGVPAKVLTQTRSNPDELVCFGCPDFINTTKPVSMGQDDYQNFLMWKRENRDPRCSSGRSSLSCSPGRCTRTVPARPEGFSRRTSDTREPSAVRARTVRTRPCILGSGGT